MKNKLNNKLAIAICVVVIVALTIVLVSLVKYRNTADYEQYTSTTNNNADKQLLKFDENTVAEHSYEEKEQDSIKWSYRTDNFTIESESDLYMEIQKYVLSQNLKYFDKDIVINVKDGYDYFQFDYTSNGRHASYYVVFNLELKELYVYAYYD